MSEPVTVQLRIGATKDRKRFTAQNAARTEALRRLARLTVSKRVPSNLAEETLRAAATCPEKMLPELFAIVEGHTPTSGKLQTVEQLGRAWTSGELHDRWPDHVKLKRSADADRQRLAKHVYPLIGGVPLRLVTLEHCEQVMQALSRDLAPGSRRQVAQLLGRLMGLAVYPVRVIKVSPIPRGWLPKPGPRKAYAIIYASEDAQLLACTAVPLKYRLLIGLLHREGLRRSEALALQWRHVDLEHETVRLESNKTMSRRFWRLSPGVAAALDAWRKMQDDTTGLIFRDVDGPHLSSILRQALKTAGVTRSELFEQSDNREHVGAHSLRRSFVTRSLALGKGSDWVRQRTGHVSSELLRYRQAAQALAELQLQDLLPLNEAIPELRPTQSTDTGDDNPPKGGAEKTNDSAVVRERGVEPPRVASLEPKSDLRARSRTKTRQKGLASESVAAGRHLENGGCVGPVSVFEPCKENGDTANGASLVKALTQATEAGQWELASQIAALLARG